MREVVANQRIENGEELTISYTGFDREVPRTIRRARLKELFHFECRCEECDKTQEDIEKEELDLKVKKEADVKPKPDSAKKRKQLSDDEDDEDYEEKPKVR